MKIKEKLISQSLGKIFVDTRYYLFSSGAFLSQQIVLLAYE